MTANEWMVWFARIVVLFMKTASSYRPFLVDSSVAQIRGKLVVSTTVLRVVRKGLGKSEELKRMCHLTKTGSTDDVLRVVNGLFFTLLREGVLQYLLARKRASQGVAHSAEQQKWTYDPQSRVHIRVAVSPSDSVSDKGRVSISSARTAAAVGAPGEQHKNMFHTSQETLTGQLHGQNFTLPVGQWVRLCGDRNVCRQTCFPALRVPGAKCQICNYNVSLW